MLNNFWPRLKAAWTTFRDWEDPAIKRDRFMKQVDDRFRFALENATLAVKDRIYRFVNSLDATSMPPSTAIEVFINDAGTLSKEMEIRVVQHAVAQCNALVRSPVFQKWAVTNAKVISQHAVNPRAA
jgi:hypothetical protein